MSDRETIAEEVGEFLERLGRRLSRVEHDSQREQRRAERMERHHDHLEHHGERMADRAERMAERVAFRFGFNLGESDSDGSHVDVETDGPVVERDLLFNEEPELRFTAGPMSVRLRQVEPGGKARLELRGREAHEAEIEIGTWDNAVAVEVRPSRGFRGFSNFSRMTLYLYLPEGVRVRGRVDAGSISAEGLNAGDLDLRTDAGKLRLENCQGRMRLVSSAGKIALENCSGALEARTDAGKIQIDRYKGTVQARADAGAISCRALRLTEGQHSLETKLGSVDASLVLDLPLKIETHASLGSVHNRIGAGQPDASSSLSVRTELGSIRLRYEEAPPTPLRSVPLTDDRDSSTYKPVDLEQVPLSDEGSPGPATKSELDGTDSAAFATAGGVPEGASPRGPDVGEEPEGRQEPATAPDTQTETIRILGMVERHEINAGEAATLLAALRRS